MGNIIAMASVLSFMGYIFSVTGNSPFQEETPSKVTPIMQFFKIFQDGSKQLGSYLVQKSHLQGLETSHTNTIAFAFLAILLLVFIDKIAGHFFYRSKI
jgi:hypothetical protein